MRDLIISIFGMYTPVTDFEGNIVLGVAGVDWPFLSGVLLFAICLWSFFHLLGSILKK